MGVVADDLKIIEVIVKEAFGLVELELRVLAGLAGELFLNLLDVVVVDVAIPTGPDELAYL